MWENEKKNLSFWKKFEKTFFLLKWLIRNKILIFKYSKIIVHEVEQFKIK